MSYKSIADKVQAIRVATSDVREDILATDQKYNRGANVSDDDSESRYMEACRALEGELESLSMLVDILRSRRYGARKWRKPEGATANGPVAFGVRKALGFGVP